MPDELLHSLSTLLLLPLQTLLAGWTRWYPIDPLLCCSGTCQKSNIFSSHRTVFIIKTYHDIILLRRCHIQSILLEKRKSNKFINRIMTATSIKPGVLNLIAPHRFLNHMSVLPGDEFPLNGIIKIVVMICYIAVKTKCILKYLKLALQILLNFKNCKIFRKQFEII